jgi:hypothetical protein
VTGLTGIGHDIATRWQFDQSAAAPVFFNASNLADFRALIAKRGFDEQTLGNPDSLIFQSYVHETLVDAHLARIQTISREHKPDHSHWAIFECGLLWNAGRF